MSVHIAYETPQDVQEQVYEMVKALGKDGRGALKRGANEVTKVAERGTAQMVVMAENSIDVAVLMGSDSDLPIVNEVFKIFDDFGVNYTKSVLSAHRTPHQVIELIKNSESNGCKLFIAAAGMAAHLAGAVAAHSLKPVIGIPIESGGLGGLDSLLSTAQMPPGIPVATVAVGKAGAKNSAILAVQMLAISNSDLAQKMSDYRQNMTNEVLEKNKNLNS